MKLFAFAARQPELQRQLWLEFSFVRVVAMPVVLGLVFAAAALGGSGALATAAPVGFVLIVWVYGARLASAALTDEVVEGTWDAQRLSSLGAWQLAGGKLFGGTAFAWYGGVVCLAVLWGAAWADGRVMPWLVSIGLIAGGLALQATALIVALATVQRASPRSRRGGGWWWALPIFALPWASGLTRGDGRPVAWWGMDWPAAPFFTTMAIVFAGWAVLGAWRAMGSALKLPRRPLAWVGFLLWLAVFAAGFIGAGSMVWGVATALALIAVSTAYATLFLEPPRIDVWQRLGARWRDSGFGRVTQQRLPLMAVSTALALGGGVVAAVLGWSGSVVEPGKIGALSWWGGGPLVLALLTLRDMALACALHWARDARRADGATLVLLVVINLVLPWFLLAVGLNGFAMGLQPLVGVLDGGRTVLAGGWIAVIAAALQAAAAVAWARSRWQAAEPGASPR